MKKFVVPHVWWITLLLSVALLFAHTFALDQVQVDSTSIILLIVIGLSPLASTITRLKFGELEAEIRPQEIEKLQQAVSTQIDHGTLIAPMPELTQAIATIQQLTESDPILALADLRIEIEKTLTRLYQATATDHSSSCPIPLGQVLSGLANSEIVPRSIVRSTQDAITMCNRAIHGEDIRGQDARSLIEAGMALLAQLTRYADGFDRTAPSRKKLAEEH